MHVCRLLRESAGAEVPAAEGTLGLPDDLGGWGGRRGKCATTDAAGVREEGIPAAEGSLEQPPLLLPWPGRMNAGWVGRMRAAAKCISVGYLGHQCVRSERQRRGRQGRCCAGLAG